MAISILIPPIDYSNLPPESRHLHDNQGVLVVCFTSPDLVDSAFGGPCRNVGDHGVGSTGSRGLANLARIAANLRHLQTTNILFGCDWLYVVSETVYEAGGFAQI